MEQGAIRGSLNIKIDSSGLVATGVFTRDPDGMPVDVAHVRQMLKDKGIVSGYTEKQIAEQLQSLLPEPPPSAELVLAKGIPPAQHQPETAQFHPQPIPAEYTDHAERILKLAGPPEIFIEHTERVPIEKTVIKKSALPFAPPKKETVKTTETRTRKERVYVDPTIVGTGYAYKNDKVADIFAGEDGTSGWNIFDEEIPPKEHGDPHFYAGQGLKRVGSELVAVHDGVLRWGSHWAEILEFVPHSYTLTLSPDKATCLLNFFPGDESVALPDEDNLREQISRLKYPEDLLIDFEDIYRLMRQSVQTRRPVENIPLSVSRDAAFEITVSEDKMTALLQLHKGRGKGKPLRLKEVGVAIKQSGLAGLDLPQIKEDLLSFYTSHEADMTGYVLARGTEPEEGPERELTFSAAFLEDKDRDAVLLQLQNYPVTPEQFPSLDEFPIDAVEQMAPVELEQRIITLSPPEPGAPGKDVYGKSIPGKPGKPANLKLHENLTEKGNLIISTAKGILDKGDTDGLTHLRVRPHKDAEVLVEIAPDAMSAVISLFGSVGSGRPLTEDMVFAAVNDAKVVRGVDEELLRDLTQRAQAGENFQSVTFARGKQPVAGGQTSIKFSVHLASHKGVSLRQDGTADYRNQDNITRVSEGDLIAVVMPPTVSPEDGYEVTGRVLSASRDTGNELQIDDSVRQEPREDGTIRLYATLDGELVHEDNSIAVRSSHTIKGDVSMDTGNIRFPGTVQITGSILQGFYVMSGGDVNIGGAVEGSLVSAEGDIKIMQGIKGAKKAVIRTKKGIQTMFAEQATMLAVEDIQIKNSIMHCRVKANGSVRLYQDKSTILGGVTRSRYGLTTSQLGSPRGIRTQISFGQDYLIGDKIEQEEKEIDKIKKPLPR